MAGRFANRESTGETSLAARSKDRWRDLANRDSLGETSLADVFVS